MQAAACSRQRDPSSFSPAPEAPARPNLSLGTVVLQNENAVGAHNTPHVVQAQRQLPMPVRAVGTAGLNWSVRDGNWGILVQLPPIHPQTPTQNPTAPRVPQGLGEGQEQDGNDHGGPFGGCRCTLPPAGDPGCALRNAEATQCKFFCFVAAATLPWSHGREQTQLAPCFLSTFHPMAFGLSTLTSQDLPWLGLASHPCQGIRNRAGLHQQPHASPSSPTLLVQGPARGTEAWDGREMEVWMGTAQEKGKDCARDAHVSPQILEKQLTPSPALLRFGAEAKGQHLAEPEKGRSAAMAQPGRWHQALSAQRP